MRAGPRALNVAAAPCGRAAAALSWGLVLVEPQQAVVSCSEGFTGSSSSAGMALMLSAENMRRPSSCQCSSCSSSTAPTKRV